MEVLLDFFKKYGVAIQITLDIGKNPTVHSISKLGLQRVEADTLVEALEQTKEMIFGIKA